VIWKKPTPLGFSSFAISNGRAFTLVANKDKKETLIALNADSGEQLWAAPLGSSVYEQGGGNAGTKDNRGGDGPRSTPTSDGKLVFVYDSHMLLSCFDAETGNPVWSHDIVAEFGGRNIKWLNATSPLLDGNMIFVGGGGPGKSFLAFDKTTGKLLWETADEMMTHATPHVATIDNKKQLVFFTQSGLVSVDPGTGREFWRTKFPFSVSTAASPVISGNYVYASAGYGVGAGLFKVNGEQEPDEVWFQANKLMNHWSTPLAHDGHLYGIYEFKKYGKAPLKCIDMMTGEIKWEHPGFGPGNCILVGDKLIVLSDAGELVIASARSDKYEELARADVLSGKCWSTPAYADGKVYVRSTEEAVCIDLQGN
jgi:outer membrane protein assembly factor BamB